MKFQAAVTSCFKHYFVSYGRASRSEFWYWQLFTVVGSIVCMVPDYLLFGLDVHGDVKDVFGLIFNIITFLPSVGVMIRRLHDINRTGWWWLISLTVIGLLPLIWWWTRKGTSGSNPFGPDPLHEFPSVIPS